MQHLAASIEVIRLGFVCGKNASIVVHWSEENIQTEFHVVDLAAPIEVTHYYR